MDNKTVLVVSRHPHLEDVRKHVLEQAGYQVITVRTPEQVEDAKDHKVDLAVIGYSVTPSEKRLIAAKVSMFCKCPILELWDRVPPQIRSGSDHVFDHFSLQPEDFLKTVHSILRGTASN